MQGRYRMLHWLDDNLLQQMDDNLLQQMDDNLLQQREGAHSCSPGLSSHRCSHSGCSSRSCTPCLERVARPRSCSRGRAVSFHAGRAPTHLQDHGQLSGGTAYQVAPVYSTHRSLTLPARIDFRMTTWDRGAKHGQEAVV